MGDKSKIEWLDGSATKIYLRSEADANEKNL